MLNERNFVVDSLVVNNAINLSTVQAAPGGTLTLTSPVINTSTINPPTSVGAAATGANRQLGYVIYSNFNGTTGFVTAANAADKIVDQFTLPAGTLVAGRTLNITSWGIRTATINSVVVKHVLGGTGAVGATIAGGTIAGLVASTTSSGIVLCESQTLIQVAASNANSFCYRNDGSATQIVTLSTASTVDFTAAVLINLTMNTVASTDQTTTGWAISIS